MLKQFSLFFFVFLFFQVPVQAQITTLDSQAAVDAFDTSITNLEGKLIIEWNQFNANDPIVDLSNLSNLVSISGDLDIRHNTDLENLEGLGNLTSVGGYMLVDDNIALENFEGLNSLTSIGDYLYMRDNNALENLEGLNNLTSISDYLLIQVNDALMNLDGLNSLTSIGGDLRISNNHALTNWDGLISLASIGGFMDVYSNSVLTNLDGLTNLTSIGEYAQIYNHDALISVNGLNSLTSIGGNLWINNNPELCYCCGFRQLLLDNTPDNMIIEGTITFNDNSFGCNSQQQIIEIVEKCTFPSVSGCKFWDVNQNGIREADEAFIPTIPTLVLPEGTSHIAQGTGCFSKQFVENGTFVLTYAPSPYWQLTSDSSEYNITITDDTHISGLDFGFIPTESNVLWTSHIAAGIPRCNSEVTFDFNFRNEGTKILSGTMWGEVWTEFMDVTNYIHPPDTIDVSATGTRWGWFFEDLDPGELVQRRAIIEMPSVNEFMLGDLYLVTSHVEALAHTGEMVYYDFSLEEEIRCSYDPNDKLVSPNREGDENYTFFDEALTYTVRFQNTGNDVAFAVVIQDTLDNSLDASTFRVIASSHQDILHAEMKENQYLTFTFDNILLPDSTTNFNGSQGYVTYSINPKEGLDENTIIENTASIYFDMNPAIITNTIQNTMVSCLPIVIEEVTVEATFNTGETYTLPDGMVVSEAGTYTTELLDEEGCPTEIIITILDELTNTSNLAWDEFVSLSPNPTKVQFILDVQSQKIIDHQLVVTDIHGQQVFTKYIHDSQTEVNVEHLTSGIYWIQLRSQANELVAVQKLIIAR